MIVKATVCVKKFGIPDYNGFIYTADSFRDTKFELPSGVVEVKSDGLYLEGEFDVEFGAIGLYLTEHNFEVLKSVNQYVDKNGWPVMSIESFGVVEEE